MKNIRIIVFIKNMTKTKKKQPRAENLVMLMEWLRLGQKFHIHKEFLLYLEITDIAKLCFSSKHYLDKYFRFSCLYYIGINNNLLHRLRITYSNQKLTRLEVLKNYEKNVYLIQNINRTRRVLTLRKMYQHNKVLRKTIHSVLTQT